MREKRQEEGKPFQKKNIVRTSTINNFYQNPLNNMRPLEQLYNPFFYPKRPFRPPVRVQFPNTTSQPPQNQNIPPPQSQQTQTGQTQTGQTQTAPTTQTGQTQTTPTTINSTLPFNSTMNDQETDLFPNLQSNNPLSFEEAEPLEEFYNRCNEEQKGEQREDQREEQKGAEERQFPLSEEDNALIAEYDRLRDMRRSRRGRRSETREAYERAISKEREGRKMNK